MSIQTSDRLTRISEKKIKTKKNSEKEKVEEKPKEVIEATE